MNSKRKKQLIKIIMSFLIALAAFLGQFDKEIVNILLYIGAYIIVGYDVLLKAIKNIFRGRVFDENFLMTVATIGAIIIGEMEEAVAVMLFYQVGELFQSLAIDKSRKSIANLMDIRPDYAYVYRDQDFLKVDPLEVKVGEVILVKPGEKIPLDGVIMEGESSVDTRALTGEAVPKRVRKNDEVLSGCINNEGILKIKVSKEFGESTVSKILDLVENASSKKSKSENFISKFARIYTPFVVIIALLLVVVPYLVLKNFEVSEWLYRSLSFLVVSCPCALVVSIPLSFFGGIGASSKKGILIKGSNYLEALARVEVVVSDKTGTLTEGEFKVQKIDSVGYSHEELLKYAVMAEHYSNHPIALSLKEAYMKKINEKLITETEEISGMGIKAIVQEKEVLVGNEKLMQKYNVKFSKSMDIGTIVYVAIDKNLAGTILIADKIKEDTYKAMKLFKNNNVRKIVMLTGDQESISRNVAEELGIDEYHAELLPNDKVNFVEKLSKEKSFKGKLLFVGDGINDAPVLALSDIGVAMGAAGSDAAIEAADIVIMSDEISRVIDVMQISHKTMRIVKENIVLAIAIKVLVLILSAFGLASMWAAVFADVGVSVLAVLNAFRILNVKEVK